MTRMSMILFLWIIWIGFSNDIHLPNVLLGLGVAALVNFILMPHTAKFKINLYQLINLIVYMLWELIYSSVQVGFAILNPSYQNQSGFITVPLACKHISQISLLSNLISLTPGSLGVDICEQENALVIHLMFMQDETRVLHAIKNILEPKILKVLQYD